MHANECWIEEVKPHCATDQPMFSTQCATFLSNMAVPGGYHGMDFHLCRNSSAKHFMPAYGGFALFSCLFYVLCLLGATVVFMVMFRFQGGSTRASMTKLVSQRVKVMIISRVFICIDIAMRYLFARFVAARLVVAESTDAVFIPVVSFVRRRSVPPSAPLIGAPFFVLCLWSNQI